MSSRHSPNLDLYLLSQEVEDSPAVNAAEMRGGGLVVDTANQAFYIFESGGPHKQITEIPESADRVLITVQNGFLEFRDEDILLYELGDVHEYGELLRRVLIGETVYRELKIEETSRILSEAGYVHGYTPESIAELLTGWAISSENDSVLDIATGSGSLLKQAVTRLDTEKGSNRLTGVEIYPFIAKLAKIRVRDIDNAEIINKDFFDWRTPEQSELVKERPDEHSRRKYDVVVGNPPIASFLPPKQRQTISKWVQGTRPSLAAAFVAKAVSHLKDGGRGAFVLPKMALKDGLLNQLTESCSIHRIVELPLGLFADSHSVELVILTLVKEERDPQAKKTGIARFNQMELPDNARGLFQQPLDAILENRYNHYDAELVKTSHADLEGRNILRMLSNPSIYDILTSEGFTKLGELSGVEIGSGVSTGNNDIFYFDSSEKEESGIDERFFRPVIKNPPDDIRSISEDVINLYLLDLTRYIETLEAKGMDLTEQRVLEELENDGYTELVEYVESSPLHHQGNGFSFIPNYLGKFQNPNLIIPKFFDEPVCYTVEVDDAVFDSTVIGVQVDGEQRRDALARLLNTPLYREFFQTYAKSMDLNWYRIHITQLREIPIIEQALNEDTFDRLEPFFPPEDDNDLVKLNHILIESYETEREKQALRRYLASRDNFAWSWFLTLPEFDEFQELLESDRKQAQEFVIDRFDQELLDQARQTFRNVEFFEERRELLDDLLMEFEEGHYRGFLAGIVLQFEGVLADLVEEAGGDIVEEDGKTEFKMPGKHRSQKRKNLDNLISQFFDGVFSEYLHETVRQRRNRIAHGDVIEDSRTLSIHFFVSFYALCNACLNEYVRIAQQQDSGAAAT
ncbi:N-6 adenine-specific DNA methylase domain-containing protein [Natrialba chahannaoensis JCM 10990]|uniref:N-6 adenine-specific DNA methylase domain-containing protein n=1 Tax=Natrialba chahannaoensis JCM 10990 TaxID=1227492 RepID=M0B5T6_9EURY|nr:N-6 DNA methylase [Natrialba chahannaoensis]ELZ06175.1 N-6 adenine-specific DNA methylase domain-containing protein [Natrialba chahannaoensis JCM 10990]